MHPNATIGHDTVLQGRLRESAAVVSVRYAYSLGVGGRRSNHPSEPYIGDGTTIGAGAVVTKDPPAAIVVGIPGRWGWANAADDRHGNLPLTEVVNQCRVLIISQYYSPENVHIPSTLARRPADNGHSVKVLTGYPNYPEGAYSRVTRNVGNA